MDSLIDPFLASKVLRDLALKLEQDKIVILNITYHDWRSIGKESFSIEWNDKKEEKK